MNLDEIIRTRRSIRKFIADKVPPRELVDQVVRAGLEAPTGRNRQASTIIRIEDRDLQARLRKLNADIMGPPPPGRLPDPFYLAPVILLVVADKSADTAPYDGALTLGHMMLKAHELGLASCWIHRAREEMETGLGREILARAGLEGEWIGVGHLALGYADMELPPPHPVREGRYREI